MTGMAGTGWKWLKMTGMPGKAGNGWKWLRMARNLWKKLEIAGQG